MGACKEICVGFSKCILFVFNLLILIFAIIIIARSVSFKSYTGGLDIKEISSFGIGLGVVLALIAFAGCWGAIRENSCCLTIYAGILLTLFVIQVILAIIVFVGVGAEDEIKKSTLEHLAVLYKEDHDKVDNLQRTLHCCGINGPKGPEVVVNSTLIMPSCCKEGVTTCTVDTAYPDGCSGALTTFIVGSLVVTGIIAIFFALIEVICAIFAFCVRGSIRKEGELLP